MMQHQAKTSNNLESLRMDSITGHM